VSDEIRGVIIRLHLSGVSAKVIRLRLSRCLLEYSLATVYRVLKHWELHHRMTHAPSTPRSSPKSLAAMKEQICALQDSNHALTLAQIRSLLPQRCSLSHISRVLSREKFTTKRMQKWVPNRNSESTKKLRFDFVTFARQHLTPENTIYIDESPFNISMTRGYGRSRIGTPCFTRVPLLRSPNYSVIAALCPSAGIVFHHVKMTRKKKSDPRSGGVNGDDFYDFIVVLLALLKHHRPQQKFFIVYDNVAFHKKQKTMDLIAASGHTLRLLSPYSPCLNPIEECFSKWKALVYGIPHNTDATLRHAISTAARMITPGDGAAWFRHTLSFHEKALAAQGQSITIKQSSHPAIRFSLRPLFLCAVLII
jgi:transposase